MTIEAFTKAGQAWHATILCNIFRLGGEKLKQLRTHACYQISDIALFAISVSQKYNRSTD